MLQYYNPRRDYCEKNFNTSLASFHSFDDWINLRDLRPVEIEFDAWIGLNDEEIESVVGDQSTNATWQWSDDTPYDYAAPWAFICGVR